MMRRPDSPSIDSSSRRQFVRASLAGACAPALITFRNQGWWQALAPGRDRAPDPWQEASQILSRVSPPSFPEREFNITDFGAIADNRSDCTSAFAKAIRKCQKAGGGTVVVPKGEFLTKYALYMRGLQHAPIEHVRLSDCDFEGVQNPNVIEDVNHISFDNVRINGKLVS